LTSITEPAADELTLATSPSRTRWMRFVACAHALGGPWKVARKLLNAARVVAFYCSPGAVRRRTAQLAAKFGGPPPSYAQTLFAGFDMVRYLFVVFGKAFVNLYREQQLDGTLISVVRVLRVPSSAVDLFGLASNRDDIIDHVLQVTHVDVTFDLHLLELFPNGIDELERSVRRAVDGTHPDSETLRLCVEDDPSYHARLLEIIAGYRRDSANYRAPRRPEVRTDPAFEAVLAEEVFSTMPNFLAYARRMPTTLSAYRAHQLRNPTINSQLCDARLVEQLRERAGHPDATLQLQETSS
jgi:hypothetical protein